MDFQELHRQANEAKNKLLNERENMTDEEKNECNRLLRIFANIEEAMRTKDINKLNQMINELKTN